MTSSLIYVIIIIEREEMTVDNKQLMHDMITDWKIEVLKKGVNNLTTKDEMMLRYYDRLHNLVAVQKGN